MFTFIINLRNRMFQRGRREGAKNALSQYPDIPISQYPADRSRYPNIPISQYPRILGSIRPNIPISQYPNIIILGSTRPNIPISQYPNIIILGSSGPNIPISQYNFIGILGYWDIGGVLGYWDIRILGYIFSCSRFFYGYWDIYLSIVYPFIYSESLMQVDISRAGASRHNGSMYLCHSFWVKTLSYAMISSKCRGQNHRIENAATSYLCVMYIYIYI